MSTVKSKRRLFLFGAGILLLAYGFWPTPLRPVILYAYSDNALGMWGLTLFKDGQFTITLPAAYESGRFHLSGDTIELHYNESGAGLPQAYLINRSKKQIDELNRVAGWWKRTTNLNWAELHFDSTRYYAR
ncbi:hypothetical protein IC235_16910 [Hymenobacter sp. BT664]|uniref:Uncharacterized protein n=1 Tax=Hymenobacter montanus TaxID=2771359 RepID=A0A927GKW9_9BACT|nr:hypothetical protein [Hymenobacter montanus]MBD2769571.1 hypothetical protein [Hymenobacter montanus]